MKKNFKQMQSHAGYGTGKMESGDHFKNGACPKSLTGMGRLIHKSIFKPIVCLVAFMWLAGVAQTYAQQNDGEELRRHIRYAKTAYDRGEYPNALREYREALKLAPNYPELYKAIGDVHEKLATAADLNAAITHYKRYLELAPNAGDARQIKDKIYDLEYIETEQVKQDRILDDLSGEWVAVDNIGISKIEKDGKIKFLSDFIFQITEIQKTGKYRISMKSEGSRYYNANLIEKTVNIVPAKDNSFTFIFADATAYTPTSGKYDLARGAGNALGAAVKSDLVSILTDAIISAAQESDLPSNTQTSYTFALKYEEGKLVGLVNIVGKYADATRQQTTGNEMYEITFMKKDDGFNELLLFMIDDKPNVIADLKAPAVTKNSTKFKDKWGKRLSQKEIASKLYAFDPQLGKKYSKVQKTEKAAIITTFTSEFALLTGIILWSVSNENQQLKTTGQIMTFSLSPIFIAGISIGVPATSKKIRLINQYNEQIIQQHKNKPTKELRFGVTPSGGVGLTFNF
ncbi:MAG: tetratricopeptide repeat protein [Prevotellaceae bacterium]|jgi:tetratricopeptide (TPR) repeat protein|nr:tetratricopeptide repeat protein [Prevotellaceae bacterium]